MSKVHNINSIAPSSLVMPAWCTDVLRCCECEVGALKQDGGHYRCSSCAAAYPITNRVPLLLRRNSMVDAAEQIAHASGGLNAADVAKALSSSVRYRLHDPVLRGEFSQIVERYASFFPDEAVASVEILGHPLLLAEYFGAPFIPGEKAFRSFRIRNATHHVLRSDKENPFNLSYILRDGAGKVVQEGPRSSFPIPLIPGRDITVPVLIEAPKYIGNYRIEVMVVQEFVRWFDNPPLFVGELIVSDDRHFRDSVEFTAHEGFFDFQRDLEYCGQILADVVRHLRSNLPISGKGRKLRVLELACGSDPQVLRHFQPQTQVVALDLCYPQSQIGALQYAKSCAVPSDDFLFASGDVLDAPLRKGAFDLVVICAALHHFSDVVSALRKMAELIHASGRIVLLREPGKVCADDPTFIAELAAGFNEQQFELEEYCVMYDRAALSVDYHRMDFDCSYKAVLRRRN